MLVHIPSPLRSYTGGKSKVDASGSSVKDLLANLDAQYKGIRFRMIDEQDGIREHIQIFVNGEMIDSIKSDLKADDVVHIICALSGG